MISLKDFILDELKLLEVKNKHYLDVCRASAQGSIEILLKLRQTYKIDIPELDKYDYLLNKDRD